LTDNGGRTSMSAWRAGKPALRYVIHSGIFDAWERVFQPAMVFLGGLESPPSFGGVVCHISSPASAPERRSVGAQPFSLFLF
ncbi:MAG: hypothetical protein KFH87_00990, partial [Bacteroidetes bacterium]|nr:hypothetical protein [Bacteroidota bacterium]